MREMVRWLWRLLVRRLMRTDVEAANATGSQCDGWPMQWMVDAAVASVAADAGG